MNFEQFISEAPRVERSTPAADSEENKRLREPGDVGKVDRLKQLYKGSKGPAVRAVPGMRGAIRLKKRDVSKPGQYVDKVADEAGEARPEPETKATASDDKKRIGIKPTSQDTVAQADGTFDSLIQRAQRPLANEPVDVKGSEVPDTAYQRHAFQPSGVGIGKKLQQSDLDYIIKATTDESPVAKKGDKTGLVDRGGIENLKMQEPTARDLEAMDPEAEKQGAQDRAYLTPEVMKQQKAMRKALSTQDAKAVQKLAFQHDVSDEMIDSFIDNFGKARDTIKGPGKKTLLARMEQLGATAPMTARYGGDLGPEAEPFSNGDGTYDFNKLPPKLLAKANENRTRSMVATYLKQGGRDAYANHEGIRSITDMDLEHIRSLKSTRERGIDHPDNWVFASGELNRLRGEKDLTGDDGAVTKYAQGPTQTAREGQAPTFSDFVGDDPELQKQVKKALGGEVKNGRGYGVFAAGNYDKLTPAELASKRSQARKLGMTPEQVSALFPDANPRRPELPAAEKDKYGVEIPAYTGPGGREAYDKAVSAKARNKVRYQNLVNVLKKVHKGMGEKEVLATPEGQRALQQIINEPEVKAQERQKPQDIMDI